MKKIRNGTLILKETCLFHIDIFFIMFITLIKMFRTEKKYILVELNF